MMIVFDASTLILIAKVELLEEFLNSIGPEVVIPSTVEKECCAVKQSLDALLIRRALDEGRIGVIPVRKRNKKLYEKVRVDFALGRRTLEAGGQVNGQDDGRRMDEDNYDFLSKLSREERGDLSKAVRELVCRGRVMLAVERYKKGEASLGKAAELAGVPLGQMMTILAEYWVESRVEREDYLQGLESLRKTW